MSRVLKHSFLEKVCLCQSPFSSTGHGGPGRNGLRLTMLAHCFLCACLVVMTAAHHLVASAGDDSNDKERVKWVSYGPFGGDARRIALDLTDPNTCYVGTDDGHVYRSFDGGGSWHLPRPGLQQPGYSVQNLIVDSRDSQTLYVGLRAVQGTGGGVFKSTDRGTTWKPLWAFQGQGIRALEQSKSNPLMLVAGTLEGVFRSLDGGAAWQRISPPDHQELRNIESLAIDPRNPETLYVGTWHLPWKTTDGGASWSLIGTSRVGMINDSDIFSILLDRWFPEEVYVSACSGIYRSTNAGQSWLKIQGIPNASRRTHVIFQHWVDRDTLYAGTTQGLWKTTNRGRSWRLILNYQITVNDIASHPSQPSKVFIATDKNGILISNDSGNTFSASNQGFANRTVSALHHDYSVPRRVYAGVLYAGLGSGLYLSDDGGASWREPAQGIRGHDVYSISQSEHDGAQIFIGTNHGLYLSNDRGEHWKRIAGIEVIEPVLRGNQTGKKKRSATRRSRKAPRGTQIRSLALGEVYQVASTGSPRNNLVIATWDGVYRQLPDGLCWERVLKTGDQERVVVLFVSRKLPGSIFAGMRQGIYFSKDNGRSWAFDRVNGHQLAVSAIAEDPLDPSTLLVGTSGGLFRWEGKSEGRQWKRVGGGLPPVSVSVIEFSPSDSRQVIVGDVRHGGLYHSPDQGQTWRRIDFGFINPRVACASFDTSTSPTLYVGTYSGGVYIGQLSDYHSNQEGIGGGK